MAKDTYILQRPKKYTFYKGYAYVFERRRRSHSYYHCADYRAFKCKTRLVHVEGNDDGKGSYIQHQEHNHPPRSNDKCITFNL